MMKGLNFNLGSLNLDETINDCAFSSGHPINVRELIDYLLGGS